jgi:hypothetical protein
MYREGIRPTNIDGTITMPLPFRCRSTLDAERSSSTGDRHRIVGQRSEDSNASAPPDASVRRRPT